MISTIKNRNRGNVSFKLKDTKLIVTCAFSAIALTLYMIGLINFAGLSLIVAGAFWNFFVDINTMISFLLSLVVGLLFAFFAIGDGLYINALLYTAFYIPLQFIVWITNINTKDMSIKYDKKMHGDRIYYTCVAFLLCLVCSFAFAILTDRQVLPLFDAFSCCLLGLSAVLQSYMYREYYFVRPFAVLVSMILWLFVIVTEGLTMGSLSIVLLYAMYFVMDLISMCYWVITLPTLDSDSIEEIDQDGHKTLVQDKLEEYKTEKAKADDKKDSGNVIA